METNYYLGDDPTKWRTHVANFAAVRANDVIPGVDVVLRSVDGAAEYDLDVAPGIDAERIAVKLAPENLKWTVDANGDVVAHGSNGEFRMRKPVSYEIERTSSEPRRKDLASEYVMNADGTLGFQVEGRDVRDELVIDPAIEVTYFSFLGGTGTDSASSVAVDRAGNVYVGGITTSSQTYPEGGSLTDANGSRQSDFFVAKIVPSKSGASSLAFLTFIGGSGIQTGGNIAVDASGDLALSGTTTSYDYPVTDGSTYPVNGGGANPVNDVAISELSQTDGSLTFSTVFGGNGNEAKLSSGGVAFGPAGQIFVGMDTTSTNLPVCPTPTASLSCSVTGTAFQPAYEAGQTAGESGGSFTDGFFVEFAPPAQGKSSILYCTYLGIYGLATVSGIAVDSESNAYLAGSTSNPQNSQGFPFANMPPQQQTFGGGDFDGFVVKIRTAGLGTADLSYGTLLGGSATDKILGIAIDSSLPATAYVTGYTSSPDFPQGSIRPAFQPALGTNATANAFLAVISQSPSFATSLEYSTYLGGTANDIGNAIYCAADNKIYVAGTTTSPMFPWLYNLEPFEGSSDAFVAEIDPTQNGAGLLFSTPLGGEISAGSSAAHGNSVAVDANANVYVVGDTTSSDFAPPGNPGNWFQTVCVSCGQPSALPDAFVVGLTLSQSMSSPTVVFNWASVHFGSQPIGIQTNFPVAVFNHGDAPLQISSISIDGANKSDFSLSSDPTVPGGCASEPIVPVGTPATGSEISGMCSFAINFTPSISGTETATVTVNDNAPGGSQSIPMTGVGVSALTTTPSALVFQSIPPNTTEAEQTIQLQSSSPSDLAITYSVQGSTGFNVVPGSCQVVPAGSFCIAAVAFSPTAAGTYAGQLVISYTSAGNSAGETSVSLRGASAVAAPEVQLTPSTVSFPPTGIGTQSVTETVTVQNTGDAPAAFYGASLTGPNAGSFVISPGTMGGCALGGETIAPLATCTIAVTFSAPSAGSFSATLNVSDNAPGSPQGAPLQATAVTLGATLSTSSVGFGTSTIGVTTAPVTVMLTNSGSSPLTISSIGVSGADKSDFTAPNNCPASLGVKASCTLSVAFNPTQPGSRTATVQVFDSAPQSPQSIAVSGNAVMAQMSVSPPSVSFGSELTSTASAAQTITVTNTAASPALLQVASAAVTGSTDFSVVKNGCSAQVAAGATCSISVQFDPGTGTTMTSRTGTLVIQSNAQTSAASVALTGSADDFELGPAASGGASISVDAGSTASFSLDLTSSGGFAGTVALTCAGTAATALPGTCTITPASIAAAANAQEAFAVAVTTTSTDARRAGLLARWFANDSSARGSNGRGLSAIVAWLVLAITAFAFAFTSSRARVYKSRMRGAAALIVLMSVFLLGGVAACGGGSAATDPPDPPSSQSYSLTITGTFQTATSTPVTRTLPLTLTVNTD